MIYDQLKDFQICDLVMLVKSQLYGRAFILPSESVEHLLAAALCTLMKMATWPMSFMKRQL